MQERQWGACLSDRLMGGREEGRKGGEEEKVWRGGDRVESGVQVGEVRINKHCSVVSAVH